MLTAVLSLAVATCQLQTRVQEVHQADSPNEDVVSPHRHRRVSGQDIIASACIDGQEDEEKDIRHQYNLQHEPVNVLDTRTSTKPRYRVNITFPPRYVGYISYGSCVRVRSSISLRIENIASLIEWRTVDTVCEHST